MNERTAPHVCVILVNWNGTKDTLECLASLDSQSYRAYSTIVVDNGSNEDISRITVDFPNVTVIRNDRNLGFAAACNRGIQEAATFGAEFCWILNNDTVVSEDCLVQLVQALEENPNTAAVGHPIACYHDPSRLWFAGGEFHKGLPRHRKDAPRSGRSMDGPVATEYLTGCSFLARTKVLLALNGFDERYFCYVEDVDLSVRIKQAGYDIGYIPTALVWHKISRSTGERSAVKLYYKYRNMLFFIKKFEYPRIVAWRWRIRSGWVATKLLLKDRRVDAFWSIVIALYHASTGRMGRRPLPL